MTATPRVAVIKLRTQSSGVVQYPVKISDVNNESYEFQDGSSSLQVPLAYGDVVLEDVALSGTTADTSKADIFVNSKAIGTEVQNGLNQPTTIGRQFQNGAGIGIKAGSRLEFKQRT